MVTQYDINLILCRPEHYLEQWGKWTVCGSGLQQLSCGDEIFFDITDDYAMFVDAAVARLCRGRPETGKAIKLYYVSRFNYSDLATNLNIGDTRARSLVMQGVAYIEACFQCSYDSEAIA